MRTHSPFLLIFVVAICAIINAWREFLNSALVFAADRVVLSGIGVVASSTETTPDDMTTFFAGKLLRDGWLVPRLKQRVLTTARIASYRDWIRRIVFRHWNQHPHKSANGSRLCHRRQGDQDL